MVTRQQVQKLEARINQLADAANPPVVVAQFRGETREQAIARHLQLRPDHLGRKAKIEYRQDERSVAHEICACHTIQELTQAIEKASTSGKIGLYVEIAHAKSAE